MMKPTNRPLFYVFIIYFKTIYYKMDEPKFTIRINPHTPYLHRNRLYKLKNQKTSRILNGNKFMFNEVIKQIQKEKRKAEYQKNVDILNFLVS